MDIVRADVEEDRAEITSNLRKIVNNLPAGPFRSRMQTRVQVLDTVPPAAWKALVLVIVVGLLIVVGTKIAFPK